MASNAPRRTYRWLLVLPFGWQVGLAPLVDDVQLTPFHLPFPMFWQMAGIVFTTLVIAVVFALDRRLGPDPDDPDGGTP
ncbi:MAG: DUF3311 domain-containing protein [Steroidobacteraceae bacterium]|nr:DUF3311 domain-containing protein [Steroidobacteraceae bacterium]